MYKSKEVQYAYQKEWYRKNKKRQLDNVRRNQNQLRDWFREYKSKLSCERCGENHPATLDFHHRDPKEKELTLAKLGQGKHGKKRLVEEIAKCEVLCANCHRKEHYNGP